MLVAKIVLVIILGLATISTIAGVASSYWVEYKTISTSATQYGVGIQAHRGLFRECFTVNRPRDTIRTFLYSPNQNCIDRINPAAQQLIRYLTPNWSEDYWTLSSADVACISMSLICILLELIGVSLMAASIASTRAGVAIGAVVVCLLAALLGYATIGIFVKYNGTHGYRSDIGYIITDSDLSWSLFCVIAGSVLFGVVALIFLALQLSTDKTAERRGGTVQDGVHYKKEIGLAKMQTKPSNRYPPPGQIQYVYTPECCDDCHPPQHPIPDAAQRMGSWNAWAPLGEAV